MSSQGQDQQVTCTHAGSQTTVVIVGAGFAGVAAAAALREDGVDEVVVVEAQSRAGGRVMTVEFDGGFAELGAQFIHGEAGNLLYDLAAKHGCLMDKDLYQTNRTSDSSALDYKDHMFFTSAGQRVDQDSLLPLLTEANRLTQGWADSIYNAADSEASKDTRGLNFTSFLEKAYEKYMASSTARADPAVKDAIFSWIESWQYADNGARFEDISLEGYGKYRYLGGFGLTLSTSGLADVFSRFLRDALSPGHLRLNTAVKTVSWRQETDMEAPSSRHVTNHNSNIEDSMTREPAKERRVKVMCENGDVILADYVVVTSSVGFLKENEASFFSPPLPEKHRQAIHGMGFGVVGKVFLVWDSLTEAFGSDLEGVQFLWLKGFQPKLSSSKTLLRTSVRRLTEVERKLRERTKVLNRLQPRDFLHNISSRPLRRSAQRI